MADAEKTAAAGAENVHLISIKDRVEYLCRINNTNIKALEEELGLGKSTIVKWDKASPRTDKLMAVAEYFNVSIDWLANGSRPIKSDTPPEVTMIARGAKKMTPDDRQRMLKILRLAFPETF